VSARPAPLLRALRPAQWMKNLVVLAAPCFGLGDRALAVGVDEFLRAGATMLLFCAAASALYLFNDLRDLAEDRVHPSKRFRPLAAGELSPGLARAAAVILFAVAAAGLFFLPRMAAWAVAGYIALQLAYTLFLKRIALVDVFAVSFGFVLRALAGAEAAAVPISPWLLICTLLLALFLGLCKRRHEKVVVAAPAAATRASLRAYDERLLDQLIAIIAASTLVCYALYTLAPETVAKFGTHRLALTIPFVIFGLFRYLDLVYRQDRGDRPEQMLLGDGPLLGTVAAYAATVLAILLTR
jgi:4-hydroxybenzoate polyprenyltransferase